MSPLLIGGLISAAVVVIATAVIFWPRRPAETAQPWQAPQPDPFEDERKALRDAIPRIAAAEGCPDHAITLLEAKADRQAALIAAGTTTRANALHRLTTLARKHGRPNAAVQQFIARIQTNPNHSPEH